MCVFFSTFFCQYSLVKCREKKGGGGQAERTFLSNIPKTTIVDALLVELRIFVERIAGFADAGKVAWMAGGLA